MTLFNSKRLIIFSIASIILGLILSLFTIFLAFYWPHDDITSSIINKDLFINLFITVTILVIINNLLQLFLFIKALIQKEAQRKLIIISSFLAASFILNSLIIIFPWTIFFIFYGAK